MNRFRRGCCHAGTVLLAVSARTVRALPYEQETVLSRRLAEEWNARRGEAFHLAATADSDPMRALLATPGVHFSHLDTRHQPVFLMAENLNAARTTGTSQVWPGGEASLGLAGLGIDFLGMWDEGAVRTSHQEFGGRVTDHDPGVTSSHSTHVAGILVAAGVEPGARGMAYQAALHAWNWSNDSSEMAAAAAGGLRVSNHSYGMITGWYRHDNAWYWYGDTEISPVEAYRFGFYGSVSHDHDLIARENPGYLIVESAGNDRDDSGPGPGGLHYAWDSGWVESTVTRNPDGGPNGHDTLGSDKCGKNTLTVGSVGDIPAGYSSPADVVMSGYSNWGPTDDGRIKPDLVANGSSLYSTFSSSDTGYTQLSGTSMASPNVAGSVALLGDYARSVLGTVPRAATLKALLVHTAHEAGPAPGPDYRFGWGLLDTRSAAELIRQQETESWHIHERKLENGGHEVFHVQAAAGSALCITACWTDPAAGVPAAALDAITPMLVHDLDLRLTAPSGTVFQPWVLDPADPELPAMHGDNVTDNIEQIELVAPQSGVYTLDVRHKGSIADQDYSLLISGGVLTSCNDPQPLPPVMQIHHGPRDVFLHWDPVTESVGGCTLTSVMYRVWKSAGEGQPFTLIGTTSGNSCLDVGVAGRPGSALYRVTAVSPAGAPASGV